MTPVVPSSRLDKVRLFDRSTVFCMGRGWRGRGGGGAGEEGEGWRGGEGLGRGGGEARQRRGRGWTEKGEGLGEEGLEEQLGK